MIEARTREECVEAQNCNFGNLGLADDAPLPPKKTNNDLIAPINPF